MECINSNLFLLISGNFQYFWVRFCMDYIMMLQLSNITTCFIGNRNAYIYNWKEYKYTQWQIQGGAPTHASLVCPVTLPSAMDLPLVKRQRVPCLFGHEFTTNTEVTIILSSFLCSGMISALEYTAREGAGKRPIAKWATILLHGSL